MNFALLYYQDLIHRPRARAASRVYLTTLIHSIDCSAYSINKNKNENLASTSAWQPTCSVKMRFSNWCLHVKILCPLLYIYNPHSLFRKKAHYIIPESRSKKKKKLYLSQRTRACGNAEVSCRASQSRVDCFHECAAAAAASLRTSTPSFRSRSLASSARAVSLWGNARAVRYRIDRLSAIYSSVYRKLSLLSARVFSSRAFLRLCGPTASEGILGILRKKWEVRWSIYIGWDFEKGAGWNVFRFGMVQSIFWDLKLNSIPSCGRSFYWTIDIYIWIQSSKELLKNFLFYFAQCFAGMK